MPHAFVHMYVSAVLHMTEHAYVGAIERSCVCLVSVECIRKTYTLKSVNVGISVYMCKSVRMCVLHVSKEHMGVRMYVFDRTHAKSHTYIHTYIHTATKYNID